tara:strand:- start:2119 stop:2289 length:171 start_codon:yes stop_codon:yes gene_type:complete
MGFLAQLLAALVKFFAGRADEAAKENAKAEDVGKVPSNIRNRFNDKLRATMAKRGK